MTESRNVRMNPVLVLGHKNPDTDSICSAVAYAHLKNVTDTDGVYVAGRLGALPRECAWLFERFGIESPQLVEHVRLRARDVMTPGVVTVSPSDSMLEAGRRMQEHGVRSLPVVEDGKALGLVTMSILASRYVSDFGVRGFRGRPVRAARLADVLAGEVLVGEDDIELAGDVLIGAMEPETMAGYITPGDTLIVGDRKRTQPLALESGVACLILTGGARPDPGVVDLARERGAVIIATEHDTYGAARLIELSDAVSAVMATDVLRVSPDDLLADVAEDLFDSPHREALVEEDDGSLAGIITRSSIARAEPRRVVLVDHNEVSQSVDGVQDAEVVEIVDHHRVGDVQSSAPVLFLNMPVGSTATIVAERYRDLGVSPPDPIAGILLGAVLSDTVLLKSPTTTPLDRTVAERLASQLDLEPTSFGLQMFSARSARDDFDAASALTADLKTYHFGDVRVAIGQTETVNLDEVLAHRDDIMETMEKLRADKDLDLVLFMVTDVIREGTELLAVGARRFAERALGVDLRAGAAWLEGVLSRKKQVAGPLARHAGKG
ncbi:MAG: putative manganese-dependent inorganic diphosphatase [Coriobacteriia bacterium]